MLVAPYLVIADFALYSGASVLAITWVLITCVLMTALEAAAIVFVYKQQYA